MDRSEPLRIIVGISGASGAIYGVRALELLAAAGSRRTSSSPARRT